jgi:1-deoxy-D-xylulose-5-phosphate synthase
MLEMGKAEVLHPGDQLVIVAVGVTVYPALDAAQKLKDEGIKACVVNCRFVKPLDTELVCSLARSVGKVMTVEENVLPGGLGSAVLETLGDRDIRDVKVQCLGINDVFVEHGSQKVIRKKYGLDAEGIMRSAREMMDERFRKSPPQERSLG